MSRLNSVEKSKYIEKKYKEYLRSTFHFGSEKLQELYEEELKKETLFKGPYVDINLPFTPGKNIEQLVEEGIVCKSFLKLGNIDFKRPLYAHQEQAIRKIGEGRSVVITTGTGSGKTESFLFPILNELTREVETGVTDVGIRAIFLYPMNALVNDQMDRVRSILKDFPEIKFGFFTGDTKDKISHAGRIKYAEENDTEIPENELISREEIRNTPPHILFTNYSMLEYLLIRPNDYAVFEPERLNNWKFVVMDEAHTYYGAKGIEVSMLMRRLTAMAKNKPRFILTSATLGTQGKSENEIVSFAERLTSVPFETSDIIFSKRIKLSSNDLKYKVDGKDYLELKDNIGNTNTIEEIVRKYTEIDCNNEKEIIYDLLKKDQNTGIIYKELKNGSKDFYDLFQKIGGSYQEKEIIALIDLINYAEKNGVALFDLKYHSFVRPLSGAFITHTENPKLTLTKTNEIDELRAFEIGNCRYCNAPYIIGKIKHNEEKHLDYLFQNNEVDIYENYGENEFVKIDYFLLNDLINDEEIEEDEIEEMTLCAKCGSIHSTRDLNARECDCKQSFKKSVYRVLQKNKKEDEYSLYNNIRKCPCCGIEGKQGVVKGLNLGKDEGTALIAQILYEAIDNGEDKIEENTTFTLSLTKRADTKEKKNDSTKQFLCFSDSRQQASFSAAFLDSNHVRMLQKRIIWKVLEDNNYQNMTVEELAVYLEEMIRGRKLIPNSLTSHKNAWITLMSDLLRVDGDNDGQGLGLYYFDLNLSEIESAISEEDVRESLGKYDVTKQDLLTIIQVVMGIFQTSPAVNYNKSTLTPDEKREYLGYRGFNNNVMFECQKSLKGTRSFLPIKGKENALVRYVKKACKCSSEEAKDILDIIFNNLIMQISAGSSDPFLIKDQKRDAYQVDVSRYIIKNYKTSKYYQCSKCGRLTPYNVHEVCTQDKCDGVLKEINPDEVLANNYYRNEYKNKKIESIVVKEHTAQLDRIKAKQYQNEFKNKKINILSCSTTFEMGIDIGNLETVFMRNIPPTPANYVQRAGRAGRRKDSSAYILTYCGTGSHDYTYFMEPEKMISGVINPPYFDILNKKIIVRHLMAASLGFFFRDNPDYFKNVEELVFNDGEKEFNDYLKRKPKKLIEYLDEKVLPEKQYEEYHNLKWFDEMDGKDIKMSYFVESFKEMAKEYEEAKKIATTEERFDDAKYYSRQQEKLKKESIITMLSKYCVIPKYGFPVDVVDLEVYQEGVLKNDLNFSRDLRVALSEYAPDSEVIGDGKKYTSKYISLPKTGELPRSYFVECPYCKKVNVFLTGEHRECKYCNSEITSEKTEYFVEPIYGFKTGLTKESTRMKPKRSYSGEVTYIGEGIKDEKRLELGRALSIETSTEDELLIMNRSGFYMCPVCGYSEIVKGGNILQQIEQKHKNYRQYDCQCEEMNYLKLGHRFRTDVARMVIPTLESTEKASYARALSFLYALLEGISTALEIERNDIDGILEMNPENGSFDVLIFDNVPGGAGHVKRLMEREAVLKSLNAALAKVSQHCCDENTSCYNCLRNYYNQIHHGKLQRIFAIEIIKRLLYDADLVLEMVNRDDMTNQSYMKLTIGNDGRDPGEESAIQVWEDILEDCFDDNEILLIKQLKEKTPTNIERPYYNKTVTIKETGEQFFVNLIWKEAKTMLFLNDERANYDVAKSTGWDCYCTSEEFDVDELLKKIGDE
jgi:ATP-dependent helicase YprA (DUF1998 family)